MRGRTGRTLRGHVIISDLPHIHTRKINLLTVFNLSIAVFPFYDTKGSGITLYSCVYLCFRLVHAITPLEENTSFLEKVFKNCIEIITFSATFCSMSFM